MRDKRFVAIHRGGPLDLKRHQLLATWAADCAEHVLPLFEKESSDDRPRKAIEVIRAWVRGEVAVGAAQKAAYAAHAAAREAKSPAAIAAARSTGQVRQKYMPPAIAHFECHAPRQGVWRDSMTIRTAEVAREIYPEAEITTTATPDRRWSCHKKYISA